MVDLSKAKFGDRFKTTKGRLAVFLYSSDDCGKYTNGLTYQFLVYADSDVECNGGIPYIGSDGDYVHQLYTDSQGNYLSSSNDVLKDEDVVGVFDEILDDDALEHEAFLNGGEARQDYWAYCGEYEVGFKIGYKFAKGLMK